jgi:menaquinone-dependent protoporphyrinogen oxidase
MGRMGSVLIIYASNHGHSRKIAERLASILAARDLSAQVHEVAKGDSFDPGPFDSVIVMASIHAGRHQAKMAHWVEANPEQLNRKRTAFVSVSLSAGSGVPDVLEENRGYAEAFAEKTGWTPGRIEIVAGCLQYPAYNILNKFLMKRIAKRQGLPLDTSREYEYTDWDALEKFASSFWHPG